MSVKSKLVKIKTKLILSAIISAVLTAPISWYAQFKAESAVMVRPELAEVGFFRAIATEHGTDWIFYHHPSVGTALVFVVAFMFAIFTINAFLSDVMDK